MLGLDQKQIEIQSRLGIETEKKTAMDHFPQIFCCYVFSCDFSLVFFPPSDYQFIVSAALQLINTPALPLPHTGRILLALKHAGDICKVKNISFYYLSLYHCFIKKLYLQVTQNIRKVIILKLLFIKYPWKTVGEQ